MAVYNKFSKFTEDVLSAKHNFASDVFKVMLTDTAPVAANTVKTDITEIAAGNGYTAGGASMTITVSRTGGTTKTSGVNVLVTATGGTIGPFRYAVLYNATSGTQPLVAWWDYGSSITLANTEQLTISPDAVNGIFQIT